MTDPQQAANALLTHLTDALNQLTQPAERARVAGALLNSVPTLQKDLRAIRQAAVLDMRRGGASHQVVADELGITRARAAQIADGKTSRGAKAE